MKILLVEDDACLTELLIQALTKQNYLVETATDGQHGWNLAEAFQYDLILLDVVLPTLSGIQFCQQLRARKDFTPVILLTSQDSATHKVSGLDAGADDYVVKPFHWHELLARIRALLRRESLDRSPALTWGALQLDRSSCIVTYAGQPLSLTNKEYKLLELFLRSQQRIFSQSALLNHLWSFEEAPTENGVRAHIKGLRRKLKQAGCDNLIETVYGLGYRLKQRVLEAVTPTPTQPAASPERETHRPDTLMPIEFAAAWEHYREQYRDRVLVIKQAITALASGCLEETLRQQAHRDAHTLAGSLGSFGLDSASQSCRQLETTLLEGHATHHPSHAELTGLLEQLAAIEHRLETPAIDLAPVSHVEQATPTLKPSLLKPSLLLVADDTTWSSQLMAAAVAQGLQVSISQPFTTIASLPKTRPDVALLDLSVPETINSGFACLAALTTLQPPIPTLVLTSRDNFAERVRIARLGGRTVLQAPIAPEQLLSAIAQVLQQTTPPEGTLLLVDDDPLLLKQLSSLLQPWGFQVHLLDRPQQFWATLERTQPDLLLLDLVMPELSGLDLCRVVRNAPRWEALPILFLSANTDAHLIHRVFMAGADDYVSKPIVGPEIVARILNQLKRRRFKP